MQGGGVGDDDVDVRGPAEVELDAGPHGEASGRVDAGQPSYVLHVAVLEPSGRQPDVGPDLLAHRVLQPGPDRGGHHRREGHHGQADDEGERGGEPQGGASYGARRTQHGDGTAAGPQRSLQQRERHG